MGTEELLLNINNRMGFYLNQLETMKIPGSVVCAVHCDSQGARKVVITVEESFPIPRTA